MIVIKKIRLYIHVNFWISHSLLFELIPVFFSDSMNFWNVMRTKSNNPLWFIWCSRKRIGTNSARKSYNRYLQIWKYHFIKKEKTWTRLNSDVRHRAMLFCARVFNSYLSWCNELIFFQKLLYIWECKY